MASTCCWPVLIALLGTIGLVAAVQAPAALGSEGGQLPSRKQQHHPRPFVGLQVGAGPALFALADEDIDLQSKNQRTDSATSSFVGGAGLPSASGVASAGGPG